MGSFAISGSFIPTICRLSGRFPTELLHRKDKLSKSLRFWRKEEEEKKTANFFSWPFVPQNTKTSASDLCSPSSRVKIISDVLFLFCALSSVLCDGLLLCSGSCISVDMVVCVDWVQRSRTTQHVPPMSHFQDTFSLPHINKHPESKFSFLEPKLRLFLQTFGELNDQIFSLCFYSKTSDGVKTHHHSPKMFGNVNTNNNLCLLKVTFISIFSP